MRMPIADKCLDPTAVTPSSVDKISVHTVNAFEARPRGNVALRLRRKSGHLDMSTAA